MLATNQDTGVSPVIGQLIQKFGLSRVDEMHKIYKSGGELHIPLETWLKVALENSFKPIDVVRVTACPLCGSSDAKLIGSYIYYSHFSRLKQCNLCGLGYVDSHLNPQTITSHFETAYKNDEYFSKTRFRCYQQIIKIARKCSPGGKLLDVGCAKGHFLGMAIGEGFDGIGCDISQEAVRFCREGGLVVHQAEVRHLDYSDSSFDIITCLDSLYYSQNIKDDLLRIAALLKSDGLIVLRVPNRDLGWYYRSGKVIVKLGIRPIYSTLLFFNPEHSLVFEKRFFKNTLRKFGLDCISIEAACPGPGFFREPVAEFLYFFSKVKIGIIKPPILSNSIIVVLKKNASINY
jgi:2-polyprenyl-3-methyl-5-hydroxy-6-metoxy-1,4-benzoquinol methylase